MLSSSGELIASCAASTARFSPRPKPVPISAAPRLLMIVRTSAKSTFTSPVTRIRSLIPCVACSSTSSAFFSASLKLVPFPTTESSRSFGTTIMVSTARFSSAALPPPAASASPLEEEGLGHHRDRQRPHLPRHLPDQRRRSRARPAAHPRR
jgi:hypothetical protein